jgi:acetoin utilization deacetylase AcuC-like enzyme
MDIFYTDKHILHATDGVRLDDHPFVTDEIPARVEIILEALSQSSLGPIRAPADFGLDPILAVHDDGFVEYLRTTYAQHAAYFKKPAPVFPETFARQNRRRPHGLLGLPGLYAFGVGSPILEGTWEAAYWSAQCALSAAEHTRATGGTAYALCRPPGHHAAAALYGGFCYLNNAAIATRYLQRISLSSREAGETGPRVAILDIDYHHGNGTQEIFYADPTVLFCSLHAHPDDDYPYYWGEADERGEGDGDGCNRNWPLPQGIEDAEYVRRLGEALTLVRDFVPRYLVVSCGFDIALGDQVGGFNITTDGFREIGSRIAGLKLPTIIVQEGGYLLERLAQNALAFLTPFA